MLNVLKVMSVAALAALVMVGCGEKKPAAGGPTPAGGNPAGGGGGGGAAVDPATAGTITVKVMLKGTPPERVKIDMSDQECHKGGGSALEESVVPGNGGTLQNVFVWADKGPGTTMSHPEETKPIEIDQKGCVYHPHAITMRVKQPISVKNSDSTRHNIHSLPNTNDQFNFSQEPGKTDVLDTKSKDKTFTVAESTPFKIKCDVHGWMGMYVGVYKHPYHGVTREEGTVTLSNVPPGEYTIKIWHEKYGPQEKKVTLKDKGAETITVEYEAK